MTQSTINARSLFVKAATKGISVLGWLSAPLGIGLICLAQYIMNRKTPVIFPFDFATSFDHKYRLDLAFPENNVLGLILLIIGGVLIAAKLVSMIRPHDETNTDHRIPQAIAKIPVSAILATFGAAILFGFVAVQLNAKNASNLLLLPWIAALALIVFMAYKADKQMGVGWSLGLSRVDILYLVALVLLGLIMGAYQLGSIPNSVISDEGLFLGESFDIVHGKVESFFGPGVYSYPLASSFYQAVFLKLFGVSVWSWRFSSVFIAVLAVIPTYLLARELFNRQTAIIASVIMLTMPFFIAFERLGYNNSQSILPLTLCLYFLYVGMQRKSVLYFTLCGIAGGLGYYTYTAGRLAIIFAAGYLGIYSVWGLIRWLRNRTQQQAAFSRLIILWVAFLIAAFVTVEPGSIYTNAVAPDRANYKITESLFPNTFYASYFFRRAELVRDHPAFTIGDQEFFFRTDLYIALTFRGFMRTVAVMHTGYDSFDCNDYHCHFVVGPLPGPVSAVFYFIGLVIALIGFQQRRYQLLLIWFFGPVIVLSVLSTFPPRPSHILTIIPEMAILAAVGIVACGNYLSEVVRSRLGQVIVVVVLTGICAIVGMTTYFGEVPKLYQQTPTDTVFWDIFHNINPADQRPQEYIYFAQNAGYGSISFMPPQYAYRFINVKDLSSDPLIVKPDTDYHFYFLPEYELMLTAYMENKFPGVTIQRMNYTDLSGHVVLESWSFSTTNH